MTRVDIAVLRAATSGSAEDAQAVRIVHHQPSAEPLLYFNEPGQVRHIALSGIQPLHNDQRVAELGARFRQKALQRLVVVMLKALHRGSGEPATEHGAIVNELIVHNQVAITHYRGDCRDVGRVPADKQQRLFDTQEIGDLRLQLPMQIGLPGDQPASRHAGAILICCCFCRECERRVPIDPEIIAPSKVEVVLAIDSTRRTTSSGARPEKRALNAQHATDFFVFL